MDEFQSPQGKQTLQSPIHGTVFRSPQSLFVEENICVSCTKASKRGRTLNEQWYCEKCWDMATSEYGIFSSDDLDMTPIQDLSEAESLSDTDPSHMWHLDQDKDEYLQNHIHNRNVIQTEMIYFGSSDPFERHSTTLSTSMAEPERLSIDSESPRGALLSIMLEDLDNQIALVQTLHTKIDENNASHEADDVIVDQNHEFEEKRDLEILGKSLRDMVGSVNKLYDPNLFESDNNIQSQGGEIEIQVHNILNQIIDTVTYRSIQEEWPFDDDEIDLGSAILTSSGECHALYYADKARINRNDFRYYHCWCPLIDENQWLQVELNSIYRISGLAVQGRCRYDGHQQYVSKFRLKYLNSRDEWCRYSEELEGNYDAESIVCHKINDVYAKAIRIYPLEWNWHVAMRIALFGSEEADYVAPEGMLNTREDLQGCLEDMKAIENSNQFLIQQKQENFDYRCVVRDVRRKRGNDLYKNEKVDYPISSHSRLKANYDAPSTRDAFEYPTKASAYGEAEKYDASFQWKKSGVTYPVPEGRSGSTNRKSVEKYYQDELELQLSHRKKVSEKKDKHNFYQKHDYERQPFTYTNVSDEFQRVFKKTNDLTTMINYNNSFDRSQSRKFSFNEYYDEHISASRLASSSHNDRIQTLQKMKQAAFNATSLPKQSWKSHACSEATHQELRDAVSQYKSWNKIPLPAKIPYNNTPKYHPQASLKASKGHDIMSKEFLKLPIPFPGYFYQTDLVNSILNYNLESKSRNQKITRTSPEFTERQYNEEIIEAKVEHTICRPNVDHEFHNETRNWDLRDPYIPIDPHSSIIAMEVEQLRRLEEYHAIVNRIVIGKEKRLLRVYRARKRIRKDDGPDWIFIAMILKTKRTKLMDSIRLCDRSRFMSKSLRNLKPSVTSGNAKRKAQKLFARSMTLAPRLLQKAWLSPSKTMPLSLSIYQSPPVEPRSPVRFSPSICKSPRSTSHLPLRSKSHRRHLSSRMTSPLSKRSRKPSLSRDNKAKPKKFFEEDIPLSPDALMKLRAAISSPVEPDDISVASAKPLKNRNPTRLLSPTMQEDSKHLPRASMPRDISSSPEPLDKDEVKRKIKFLPEEHLDQLFNRLYAERQPRGQDQKTSTFQSISTSKTNALCNRLYGEYRTREAKKSYQKEILEAHREQEKVKECTFHPARPLTNFSVKPRKTDMNIHERLYSQGMLQKKRMQRKKNDKEKTEIERLKFCPEISRYSQGLIPMSNVHERLYGEAQKKEERREILKEVLADPELTFTPKINEDFDSRRERHGRIEDRLFECAERSKKRMKEVERYYYPEFDYDESSVSAEYASKTLRDEFGF